MTRRLVVHSDAIDGDSATITGSLHHYLCHVLRLRQGDTLVLVDGTGTEHEGTIQAFSSLEVRIDITARRSPISPGPRLILVQGMSRRAKHELVLQKSTELGVDWVLPAQCQRSVSRPAEPGRKLERWLEIVAHAARQCQRSTLPLLSLPQPLGQALAQAGSSADVCLLARPGGRPLADLAPRLVRTRGVAVAVGPEGGLTEEEVQQAEELGFTPVNLGPLVLRTETAAVVMLALVAQLSGRLSA